MWPMGLLFHFRMESRDYGLNYVGNDKTTTLPPDESNSTGSIIAGVFIGAVCLVAAAILYWVYRKVCMCC